MLDRLRQNSSVRLTAAVAAGVFIGLIAYRLFMWTYAWWENISPAAASTILWTALNVAAVGGSFVLAWSITKDRLLKIILSVAMGLIYRGLAHSREDLFWLAFDVSVVLGSLTLAWKLPRNRVVKIAISSALVAVYAAAAIRGLYLSRGH